MIRIGNILIDPSGIDSICLMDKAPNSRTNTVQITYKSGVVHNYTTKIIGMEFEDFLTKFEEERNKANDIKLLKLSYMVNNKQ